MELELWLVGYFAVKVALRLAIGGAAWDHTSLAHNILSVVIGGYTLWTWSSDGGASCEGFKDERGLVITIQAIHSVSDFVVYAREMIQQPIFIAHHGILVVVSLILPACSGCMWVVWSLTVAEAGSATIAIDALWRSFGFPSRGRKRVVLFGFSRVFLLYFLYMGLHTMSSQTNLTLVMDGERVFSFDFPVCKITTVGGTLSMFTVNGVTWVRMYKAYRRHYATQPREKGKIGRGRLAWTYDKGPERSASPVAASLLDAVGYGVIVLGCAVLILRDHLKDYPGLPALYGWVVLTVTTAFAVERSKTVAVWRRTMLDIDAAAAAGTDEGYVEAAKDASAAEAADGGGTADESASSDDSSSSGGGGGGVGGDGGGSPAAAPAVAVPSGTVTRRSARLRR